MTDLDHDAIRAIRWRDGRLELLDQRRLPREECYRAYEDAPSVAQAIADMVVRGAPAIGVTAAYAMVLSVQRNRERSPDSWRDGVSADVNCLADSRPTAANLFWALKRMQRSLETAPADNPAPALLAEAKAIHDADVDANRRMGAFGSALIPQGSAVLTHCNTGSLATGGFGTALGVVRDGFAKGRISRVFADETRPWLQGSRLTAWELARDGIPVSLLADGAAAWLMRCGDVSWVIVGADRIAANGDTANKIGTYGLAVAARRHGVSFMVVAPTATIDYEIAAGDEIPIEQRGPAEVLYLGDCPIAPEAGVDAWNPAFDVTPAELIDAIVTERGVVHCPDEARMAKLLKRTGA